MKNFLKKMSQIPHFFNDMRSVVGRLPTYYEDDLITWHYSDFMKDEWFVACYDSAVNAGLAVADKIHWRAHTLCWAALIEKN